MNETMNPILKEAVERYMRKSEYPILSDVCAILGIDEGEEEEQEKGIEVGDVIDIELKNGDEMKAIAVKKEADGTVFCSLNLLRNSLPMYEAGDVEGFENSDVAKYLNEEFASLLPDYIRDALAPFSGEAIIRIPTEKEMFGENEIGDPEPEFVHQWEPMKECRNRVCADADGEYMMQYWLANPSKNYASDFALAGSAGYAYYNSASYDIGVRPVFKINI